MAVFVSHSSKDVAAYSSLCLALDGQGVEHWDVSKMIAGRPLSDQLQSAIRNCEACIFIATSRSLDSKWCLAELGAFWGAGKLVVIYVAEPVVTESELPPQFKGILRTEHAPQVIDAIRNHDPAEEMPSLSGGMIYILRELELRGWGLRDLAALWTTFNDTQAETDRGYKAAKYACQCLEALGLANRFGGDEYMITELGSRLLKSPSLQKKYKRAFIYKTSAEAPEVKDG